MAEKVSKLRWVLCHKAADQTLPAGTRGKGNRRNHDGTGMIGRGCRVHGSYVQVIYPKPKTNEIRPRALSAALHDVCLVLAFSP